jgi:hypothetical protein
MVENINEHIILIQNAIQKLDDLKEWILSIEKSNDNRRMEICISDIDRCIETGNYYINHNELFNPSVFSYDNMLVNLIDTIRDNDFGVLISEKEEKAKQFICSDLILLVEKFIIVNSKFNES